MFTGLILIFLAAWNSVAATRAGLAEYDGLQYSSALVASALVSTGSPADWHIGAYMASSVPGILEKSGVLSAQKMGRLQQLNGTGYDGIRTATGAGKSHVFLNSSAGYWFGVPQANGSQSVAQTRLLALGGNATTVTITVWR
jgi:hypothetical protein